jgi:hypothetical protein
LDLAENLCSSAACSAAELDWELEESRGRTTCY